MDKGLRRRLRPVQCADRGAARRLDPGHSACARAAGFTLIELLVAMAVVAILVAIAMPSYQNQIRSSRRPDAKTALLDLAAREERYLTLNPVNGYTDVAANLGYAALPANLGTGATPDYQLSVAAATATGFLLQAVPLNDQGNDTCGTYTLDNFGNQLNIYPAATPAQTIAGCW